MPSKHPYSKDVRPELKHKFRRLFACPSWNEADKRLRHGMNIANVAKMLIERGEYTGVSFESVYRQLHRYVKSLPVAQQIRTPYVDDAVEKLTEGLDEIHEMELLIAYQMKRVGIDASLEVKMNKLLGSQRGEITALFEMLERLIAKKQELGLYPTVPKKSLVGVAVRGAGGEMTLREALQVADGDVGEGGILRMIGQAFRQSQTKALPQVE